MPVTLLLLLLTTQTTEIQSHLRTACELAWTNADEAAIDRCTKRAMASLGTADRLRDNEIKKLLVGCEEELRSLKKSYEEQLEKPPRKANDRRQ